MLLEAANIVKSFRLPSQDSIKNKRTQEGAPNVLRVLDIPKFEIDVGEQVALIGQSGGGKTTLLHLFAGLLVPDEGSIKIHGTELTRLSEQGRDRFRASTTGYVFQTFNLLPAFTALENIKLGMTFGQVSPRTRIAMDLLDRVGLADRAGYRPNQLSVGQQQRVAIARAMAGSPRLLLADEPTANVDPASAEVVLDLIRESCQQDSISLLIVTHDRKIADRFDRVEKLDEINRAFASSSTLP